MSITTSEPAVALVRLRRAQQVLIVGHRNPDGDSLGSQLAVAELCQGLGIKTVIASHDPLPDGLHELPGAGQVQVGSELPAGVKDQVDLVLTIECSDVARCGFDELAGMPILNIDHHLQNLEFGEVNFLDAEAPAVGEMIWQLFQEAEVEPSVDAATSLYVALSTDTGDYRYANATARAFRTAADLVDAGARPEQVSELVHERRSLGSARLLGEALTTLELHADKRLAVLQVDRAAFDRAAAAPTDTEDIINVPRSIQGVLVVAFLKQWDPGVVRVSLRSKGDLDVCEIAARLGGGGHRNASGCTIHGDLAEVRRTVLHELTKLLESPR